MSDINLFFRAFRRELETQTVKYSDWRQAVRNQWQFKDLPREINNRFFKSSSEKHIALQATSILIGCLNYVVPSIRWPAEIESEAESNTSGIEGIKSTHHSLYQNLNSLELELKNLYQETLISPVRASGILQPIPSQWWKDNFLEELKSYCDRLGITFKHLGNLNDQIFFDLEDQSLIVDIQYYQSKPISHLIHRSKRLVYAWKTGLIPFLCLDPSRYVLPVLKKSQESQVSHYNLTSLWNHLWKKIEMEQLTETLDLIGMMEESLNVDIFSVDQDILREMVHNNRRASDLLKLAANIQL